MKLGKKVNVRAGFQGIGLRRAGIWATVLIISGCGSAQGEGAGAESGTPAQAPATADTRQVARPGQGMAWVIFGADTVVAEVARTPEERAEGLMYREELPDGTGMLFVFDRSEIQSFWMSNTYVALDIAYMDASFNIVDIQQMEPLTTAPHESASAAMFALEVPQGWFASRDIRVGAQAQVVFGIQ